MRGKIEIVFVGDGFAYEEKSFLYWVTGQSFLHYFMPRGTVITQQERIKNMTDTDNP